MKSYPSGNFYIVKDAADERPVISKTTLFDLDINETYTLGNLKTDLAAKLLNADGFEFVKEELEIRGEKTLPSDTALVKDYKFIKYSVYGKKK